MIRVFVALAFTLALAVASVTAAAARGTGAGGVTITICTGRGPETIVLGADGQPAKPRVLCPDCTAALGPALMAGPVPAPMPRERAFQPSSPPQPAPVRAAPTGLPGARAPPLSA